MILRFKAWIVMIHKWMKKYWNLAIKSKNNKKINLLKTKVLMQQYGSLYKSIKAQNSSSLSLRRSLRLNS